MDNIPEKLNDTTTSTLATPALRPHNQVFSTNAKIKLLGYTFSITKVTKKGLVLKVDKAKT